MSPNTWRWPSNFYWNCNFSLSSFRFAFIIFAFWSVSLACEQSEKTPFFSLQSEKKKAFFSLIFALSENERRTLTCTNQLYLTPWSYRDGLNPLSDWWSSGNEHGRIRLLYATGSGSAFFTLQDPDPPFNAIAISESFYKEWGTLLYYNFLNMILDG